MILYIIEISSLEEAIRLTNPDFTGRIAAEGLFSIQELELLLLYAQRQMETRAGQGAKLLEDVLSYIQEHMTDIQAKNQIFPRAASENVKAQAKRVAEIAKNL